MRKWNLPLTYKPKIIPVYDGLITQPIRTGRKYAVGDLVAFHGWEGIPYRSNWSFRTEYFPLIEVVDIILDYEHGIITSFGNCLGWKDLDYLAELDGIDPPTGIALRGVLFGLNNKQNVVEAQVLRWTYVKPER